VSADDVIEHLEDERSMAFTVIAQTAAARDAAVGTVADIESQLHEHRQWAADLADALRVLRAAPDRRGQGGSPRPGRGPLAPA
jgi:hypothetical protein